MHRQPDAPDSRQAGESSSPVPKTQPRLAPTLRRERPPSDASDGSPAETTATRAAASVAARRPAALPAAAPRSTEPARTRRGARRASDAPDVRVEIGRIEIRAATPPPVPAPPPTPRPRLSLDDYLRSRERTTR